MLTYWLQQQTEKLRAQQRAEGVAEGIVKGFAEGQAQADARWREWYRRQVDKGIVFSKLPPPPPSENSDSEG